MESGLKEVTMHNLNYVSAKGDVEFFNNILWKKKKKELKVIFLGSHNF
jgi:hypothetical protein